MTVPPPVVGSTSSARISHRSSAMDIWLCPKKSATRLPSMNFSFNGLNHLFLIFPYEDGYIYIYIYFFFFSPIFLYFYL